LPTVLRSNWCPNFLGAAIIVMSLATDYELSFANLIPMPMHLAVDIAGGVLLVASPWLFGFADRVVWPHVIVGVFEIATGLMTRTSRDGHAAALRT
jgi:hypothetical protein